MQLGWSPQGFFSSGTSWATRSQAPKPQISMRKTCGFPRRSMVKDGEILIESSYKSHEFDDYNHLKTPISPNFTTHFTTFHYTFHHISPVISPVMSCLSPQQFLFRWTHQILAVGRWIQPGAHRKVGQRPWHHRGGWRWWSERNHGEFCLGNYPLVI